jgi:hypothetical protein
MEVTGSLLVRTSSRHPLSDDRYRTLPQDVVAVNGYAGRRLALRRSFRGMRPVHIGGYDDAKCKTAISTVTIPAPNSRSPTSLIICYFSSQSARGYRKGIGPRAKGAGYRI